jgi:hypothetical protein
VTVRISGELKSATGINISTGPPERDDLKEVIEGPTGPQGPPGPPTPVAVAYDQWPPADPQPNTLYLRLAP